jgi:hypothetical protein
LTVPLSKSACSKLVAGESQHARILLMFVLDGLELKTSDNLEIIPTSRWLDKSYKGYKDIQDKTKRISEIQADYNSKFGLTAEQKEEQKEKARLKRESDKLAKDLEDAKNASMEKAIQEYSSLRTELQKLLKLENASNKNIIDEVKKLVK